MDLQEVPSGDAVNRALPCPLTHENRRLTLLAAGWTPRAFGYFYGWMPPMKIGENAHLLVELLAHFDYPDRTVLVGGIAGRFSSAEEAHLHAYENARYRFPFSSPGCWLEWSTLKCKDIL